MLKLLEESREAEPKSTWTESVSPSLKGGGDDRKNKLLFPFIYFFFI